ncbi:MAG: protein arginine kinase [bacterium]
MSWEEILQRPASRWTQGDGPVNDVVISTRVRLARNLAKHPFPNWAEEKEMQAILNDVEHAVQQLSTREQFYFVNLTRLSAIDRQLLVEKHLTSIDHIRQPKYRAIVLREDEGVSIMVNEEDHLRIQSLFPGLQLEAAMQLASNIDDQLENVLDYAFDEMYGYLTTCPTNAGSGMRASLMVHLPGLVMLNQAGRVFATLAQLGLMARGLYGEGTEALGNIFQISNQITLGRSENELLANLAAVIGQLIEQEQAARKRLYQEMGNLLLDKIFRSLGTLTHAYLLSTKEAINLISDLRLGLDLNLLPDLDYQVLNELLILCQPGFLQKVAGDQESIQKRDAKRAALLRERLKEIKN